MSQTYTVKIPVRKYLEKFIITTEGNVIRGIGKGNYSFTWHIIRPYLTYKGDDGLSRQQREQHLQKMDGKIIIILPVSMMKTYGLHIDARSIVFINRLLSSYFAQDLFKHVSKKNAVEGRYKGYHQAIIEFASQYGILVDEEISSDALLKNFSRSFSRYNKSVGKTSLGIN